MSLPDIEKYIGNKIPFANYEPADLPELIRPKARPRKPQQRRSGGGGARPGGGRSHGQRR
jgi:hypothetical protein